MYQTTWRRIPEDRNLIRTHFTAIMSITVTRYRLEGRGSIPGKNRDFSLRYHFHASAF
jgi:hypothetical protein